MSRPKLTPAERLELRKRRAEYLRLYREFHKEHQKKYQVDWRKSNYDKIRQYNLEYRNKVKNDPEKLEKHRRYDREYHKKWRLKNV